MKNNGTVTTEPVPVVGVRLAEGRSGSTLLMQVLASSPEIVFDGRYPAEYRFLSYFSRVATMMTEPFDDRRHVGVTPFFFGDEPVWAPVPFASEIVDVRGLDSGLFAGLWSAWSAAARAAHGQIRWYAEKLAIDIEPIVDAGIPLKVIDLVRDPRDVLASIRSFTATGMDGFGRHPGIDENLYLGRFVASYRDGLERLTAEPPPGVDRLVVRYEDLVTDLAATAARLGAWLGVTFDAGAVAANESAYAHHMTSPSPTASIGRWREDLTAAEARTIAAELGDLLAPLGYEL